MPESDHLPGTLDIRVKCQDEYPTSTINYHQSNQWTACTKYVWTKSQLPLINSTLNDYISEPFHSEFINAILDLRVVENVAVAYNDYVNQACERVCNLRKAKPRKKSRGPAWLDPECRWLKRSEALRLCDLASRDFEQITSAVQSCKSYKAIKQRKKCEYMLSCLHQLETAFDTNRTEIWKLIDRLGNHRVINSNGQDPSTLSKYYEKQCVPPEAPYFDPAYEYSAKQFLENYDCGSVATNYLNVLAIDILNREFDIPEIDGVINKLQNSKITIFLQNLLNFARIHWPQISVSSSNVNFLTYGVKDFGQRYVSQEFVSIPITIGG